MGLELAPPQTVRERVAAEGSTAKKVGILLGPLIRAAAQLTEETGFLRQQKVRVAVKTELVGPDAGEEEFEELLDELIALDGWAERLSDIVLQALPVERLVDQILDAAIKATYEAMKDTGVLLR